MVARSGFYLEDGVIVQRVVSIDWDLGFDRAAKNAYVTRLHNALGDDLTKAEVTSASLLPETRMLSPIYLTEKSCGKSVEDAYQTVKAIAPPFFFHFLYLGNLGEKEYGMIKHYQCYTDVFHNPEKEWGNTQAFSLALYRLLVEQKKLSVLEDFNDFLGWLQEVKCETEDRR